MRLIKRFYSTYLSKEKALAHQIYQICGVRPDNIRIYRQAFYHKSLLNESHKIKQSNERLEFLGDAVLNTVIAEYLFKKYPLEDEGFLTKMRSKIVKRKTLNEISETLELDVILSHYNTTTISKSMLGNALEALIGAVYLDKGYKVAKVFIIQRILHKHLNIQELESTDDNYKSRLLETCQKEGREVHYEVVSQFKKRNRDRFKVQVLIDDVAIAQGEGYNKKGAEQMASKLALSKLDKSASNGQLSDDESAFDGQE